MRQHGSIVEISNRWYLRYYELRNIDGVLVRKRLSVCLGTKTTRGKTVPADIQHDAESFMLKIRHSAMPVVNNVTVADFVSTVYLDWVEQNKRPSTSKDAKQIWKNHVRGVVTHKKYAGIAMKDVRTFHAQAWLDQVCKEDLARNTVRRIQSFLSGVFTQAKQKGYFDGQNPVTNTSISPHLRKPAEVPAYEIDEITKMLLAFPEPSRTAFGVAAFSGLRRGEVEGLDWTDYRDGLLHVNRSISRIGGTHELPPKTEKSRAPVPVIGPLRELLEMYRLRCGNPTSGPIFATSSCKHCSRPRGAHENADHEFLATRISLDNMRNRQIIPALNHCKTCGGCKGKPHNKADHKFVRDGPSSFLARLARCTVRSGNQSGPPRRPNEDRLPHPSSLEYRRDPGSLHQAQPRRPAHRDGEVREGNSCSKRQVTMKRTPLGHQNRLWVQPPNL